MICFVDARLFPDILRHTTCWCGVENKPNAGMVGSDHCPLGFETWQWTLKGQPPPQAASPPASRLHYPALAWGPITLAALCVFLFSFFCYLTMCLPHCLTLPSHFSRFLSLQALFTQCFQELPVSPAWLKQTLTLFWYLIQLCSFSSHWPWSTQSIRCPGSHRAPLCERS